MPAVGSCFFVDFDMSGLRSRSRAGSFDVTVGLSVAGFVNGQHVFVERRAGQ